MKSNWKNGQTLLSLADCVKLPPESSQKHSGGGGIPLAGEEDMVEQTGLVDPPPLPCSTSEQLIEIRGGHGQSGAKLEHNWGLPQNRADPWLT